MLCRAACDKESREDPQKTQSRKMSPIRDRDSLCAMRKVKAMKEKTTTKNGTNELTKHGRASMSSSELSKGLNDRVRWSLDGGRET